VVLAIGLVAGGCASPGATPMPAAAIAGNHDPVITVTASGITFSPPSLTVTAGTPFRITLVNDDAGVAHSVAVQQGDREIWVGAPVNGSAAASYEVPGLPPGDYTVYCPVHFGMTMALTVAPAR
jgi:plastocyanin